MGTRGDGGLAEPLSVPEDVVVPLPDGVDPVLAGALGIAGVAGWLPVAVRAPVREGETVLVLGATGTVGLVAVQGARLLGAGRVVAAGRRYAVTRLYANAFQGLTLAVVGTTIVVGLAYLNVCGLSPWGMPDSTRTWGRVFEPVVAIVFVLKTVLFGLAVAVIPTAAILELQRYPRRLASSVQPGALRLLFVLLLIEGASLALKYI